MTEISLNNSHSIMSKLVLLVDLTIGFIAVIEWISFDDNVKFDSLR